METDLLVTHFLAVFSIIKSSVFGNPTLITCAGGLRCVFLIVRSFGDEHAICHRPEKGLVVKVLFWHPP